MTLCCWLSVRALVSVPRPPVFLLSLCRAPKASQFPASRNTMSAARCWTPVPAGALQARTAAPQHAPPAAPALAPAAAGRAQRRRQVVQVRRRRHQPGRAAGQLACALRHRVALKTPPAPCCHRAGACCRHLRAGHAAEACASVQGEGAAGELCDPPWQACTRPGAALVSQIQGCRGRASD